MSRKNISDYLVVKAVDESAYDRDRWACEILQNYTGEPQKVCYRAMERAHERGYLDFGVSLGTAWVTDKGKELLKRGESND